MTLCSDVHDSLGIVDPVSCIESTKRRYRSNLESLPAENTLSSGGCRHAHWPAEAPKSHLKDEMMPRRLSEKTVEHLLRLH